MRRAGRPQMLGQASRWDHHQVLLSHPASKANSSYSDGGDGEEAAARTHPGGKGRRRGPRHLLGGGRPQT